MKLVAFCLAATTVAAPTIAAEAIFEDALPFEIKLEDPQNTKLGGTTYTVIEATILNGAYFVNEVYLHCEAKNAGGYTWDVTGKAASVEPNERRSFRLFSSNGDDTGYYLDPTRVSCAIKRLDLGFM